MKTTYFLDQKPELDFDVFAINSHCKAYVLCWHINNEINTCFKKSNGIVFSKKEVYSEFDCRHESFDLSIIQNKSKRGFLIAEKNKIDFFLKITPKMSCDQKQHFLLKLNKISKILLIFELDLQKEQEAHRFIFND
tara:strand:+ start:987 stop:1394 length:408 start_codon:yes stop_codon:yes gene_type:complete